MPFENILPYSSATIHFIQTIFIGSGGLATILLSWFGVWGKIIKPYIQRKKAQENYARIQLEKKEAESMRLIENQDLFFSHIDEITKKIDIIASEFKTNGGSTLRDAVCEINADIKLILVERDAIFQLSNSPMYKSDLQGYCVMANYALCELFGATQEQMVGTGWLNFILESDRKRVQDEWQNILISGHEISSTYYVINPKTERQFLCHYRAIVNRDKKTNKVISVIGMIEEVNENIF